MQSTSPTKAAAISAAKNQAEAAPAIPESKPVDAQAVAAFFAAESESQTKSTPDTSAKTTDQATSPKADKADGEKKPRRERRRRNSNRKDESNDNKDKKEASDNKRPQRQRKERPAREREENLSNVLTIGSRLPVNQYVRIIKNVLNLDKHETLEL